VAWSTGAALVDARAVITGGPSQHRWRRGERSGLRLLGQSLIHLDADRCYVEALTAAISLD
jgi:hypothetical protein